MCKPLREELFEQFVVNREKRKWYVVRAVPRGTALGTVHYNSPITCGGHVAGCKGGIEEVRQHLHLCATRVLEKLPRDSITPRCFVVSEAQHEAKHFVKT